MIEREMEPAVTIALTAQPNGTFDLTYADDHGFDRLGVTLEQLRVEVASMIMEVRNRLAKEEQLCSGCPGVWCEGCVPVMPASEEWSNIDDSFIEF